MLTYDIKVTVIWRRNEMKKFLSICIIGGFILCGIGASVGQSDDIKPVSEAATYRELSMRTAQTNYTHTVLVEVGTATWCPDCPYSNSAWHSIYGSENYDFEYTELVYDVNPVADSRFSEFNPMWVPTSYFDAGEFVYPGTDNDTFYSYLNSSGSRVVPDLVADLDAAWFESTIIKIHYTVENNGAKKYPGTLKIYVIELESTYWKDYNGNPYHHAFLDFAENKTIEIPATGSISDTITWDGAAAGYQNITQDNIQIILAVFTDTPFASSSDPPRGNPFYAYYSDECAAVVPMIDNPPEAPSIDGPAEGKRKIQQNYTMKSIDPDGHDVYYYIDWGDTSNSGWVGPFKSGVDATINHSWNKKGTYIITVKAKDVFGFEGPTATLEVSMPTSYTMPMLRFWNELIGRFPNAFPLLQHVVGY
jgi:hypothetical protein